MDFSDLGGKPVKQNSKIDFSDLGGKPISPSSSSGIGDVISTAGRIMLSPPEEGGATSEKESQIREYVSGAQLMRALDFMSKAGKYIEPKIQKAAGYVAEKTGELGEKAKQAGYPTVGTAIKGAGVAAAGTVGTLAEASIPKDRVASALTLIGVAPAEAAEAEAAYKIPTKAQRIVSEIAGTQSGVKPKHLAAVIANPEIMSEATPSMADVGKEYQSIFKKLGMKFDSPKYKEITGMRYAPNDTQTSKLSSILEGAATKLESDPASLQPSEAFLARSAGKKALDGPLSPRAKSQMAADIASLDDFLENNGIPEIKSLGQKYFRAAAKESLSDIIPRNKQGNPAVVRSLIMAHYGKEALSALAEGKPVKAAIAAGSGAIMSPFVQGKMIPLLSGQTSPALLRSGMMTAGQYPAAISALRAQRDQ